jgi:uncharacterized delta-60 repeat protein
MEQTISIQRDKSPSFSSDNLMLVLSIAIAFTSLFALSASAQDGSLDPSFNPTDHGYGFGDGTDGEVYVSTLQPDDKVLIGGLFTKVHGAARGHIARLNADGSLDDTFVNDNAYANGSVYAITLQTDGKILIGGSFVSYQGNTLPALARLNSDGTLDASFNMGTGLNALGFVSSIRLQPDGKILVAGTFSNYNGTARKNILRLLTNGAIDPTFDPGVGPNLVISSIAQQSDGKILVGGFFTTWNGAAHRSLARLNSDGTIEAGYNTAAGTVGDVNCLALQSDGKVLVGGNFSLWGGTPRSRIARLSTSGVLDATFNPGNGPSNQVRTIVVLSTGKLLVGGDFGNYNGINRANIARVNTDGTLDATFDPGTGAYTRISAIAVQSDGKAVMGGSFPMYNGTGRRNIARVNSDGSLDAAYATNTGANDVVYDCKLQPDGKILIAGLFTLVNGVSRNRIARLNTDGSIDPTFAPPSGMDGSVYSLALQPDGKILIAGEFGLVNGTVRNRIARLNADGSTDQTFNPGSGGNNEAYRVLLQPDGKVLLGGVFTQFNGAAVGRLVRLTSTGAVDNMFSTGTGMDSYVFDFALQADGKIIVGGNFTAYNGTLRSRIARLNADGTLDQSYNMGFDNAIRRMAFQADGKLLVGGAFTLVNGYTRQCCARLNADGSVDASFDAGVVNGAVLSVAPLADGRIVFGGTFGTFGGHPHEELVRVDANGAVDPGSSMYGVGNSVFALAVQPDGKLLVGSQSTRYGNSGRNRFTRVVMYAGTNVKLMLQGPYNGTTMNDALRTLPTFPLTAPFTGMGYNEWAYVPGATIAASVLSVTGNNAIVDWVLVEMRQVATPGIVDKSVAALLQRDGDVVALDGITPLTFGNLAAGNYCLAVKPRNHLPVMQAVALPMAYGPNAASVNFTLSGTAVYDGDARILSGSVMLLAAGDVTFNEEVKYTGAGNDRDPILTRVGSSTPNNAVSGYYLEDANMDGTVKYTGSGNDRDPILTTIGGTIPTNTRLAQLP